MKFGPIHVDHIGIAVDTLEEGSRFWRLLGLLGQEDDELVEDQGVTTRFFSTSTSNNQDHPTQIELLEPTGPDTPIGRFISKKGKGVQQICFRVGDLNGLISHLISHGVVMIDSVPRKGSGGKMIAFVHPKSTGGVLVELTEGS